jgi:molecular chaperone GrpE
MNEDNKQNDELNEDIADAAARAPEGESAEALLAEREAEIADLKDRLLRAAAETENVRRRLEREKADASAYAATGFARDMLSIADNLNRAIAAIPESARENDMVKSVITGVEMTAKELESVFQRHGISRVESVGQKLDPHRHQAMMEIEHDSEPGTIVQELQAGYVMKDRLLRPALVGVAKAKANADA